MFSFIFLTMYIFSDRGKVGRALPIPILILVAEALTIDMKLTGLQKKQNRRGKHVI